MRHWNERIRFRIRPGAPVLLAALLLMLPLQWVAAMLIAAAFHECCHCVAVLAMGGKIHCVTIGTNGAVMEISPMSENKELVAALAGPIGSILLILLVRILPRVALCGAVQGVYNLMPLLPLDGGRVLSCACFLTLSQAKAEEVIHVVQRIVCVLLIGLALVVVIRWKFWTFLLILIPLLLRSGEIKLAKKPVWIYNRNNIDKGERL